MRPDLLVACTGSVLIWTALALLSILALGLAGKEVRLSVAGDRTFQPRQVRSGEFNQFAVQRGIERCSLLFRDRLQRPKDVLGEPDGDGAKGQQRRQDSGSVTPERILYLGERPSLHRDAGGLTPREAPLPAYLRRIMAPACNLAP